MWKKRIIAIFILVLGFGVSFFIYKSEPQLSGIIPNTPGSFLSKFPFKLGLDLSGGTHLVYRADVSQIKSAEISDSMSSLRDVIERRVNLFGVSEPTVQVEEGGITSVGEHRLIVDLPNVTDVQKAVVMIGQTPLLEFKTERPAGKEKDDLIKKLEEAKKLAEQGITVSSVEDPYFVQTPLTGRYLDKAILEFDQNTGEAKVGLKFNAEGAKLFEQITKDNIGKMVAIYLDGSPISTPNVREAISGGEAQISGNFTPTEAKQLVGRLNSGALPVPIELISTQTIGPSLGAKAIQDGIKAALVGLIVIAIFLILWYRLPGLLAVIALSIYICLILMLFKLIPVTLTAAGIAGFIISIGVAVDANVLIFERIKEELRTGKTIADAIKAGFSRAWFSIRDSNTSSIITAIILFWFGTSLIKGFALTFGMGVLVSMLSAIIITRLFLFSLNISKNTKFNNFLFGSGFHFTKKENNITADGHVE
ncbi:MAG: protein translocase subunit SecD [Candidatus Paceibacterota bacterium]|jgi:protein-export membrane protein SecD